MGDLGWGLVMISALMILCVVIIVIASFHVVWLIRLVISIATGKPSPPPPFSKRTGES